MADSPSPAERALDYEEDVLELNKDLERLIDAAENISGRLLVTHCYSEGPMILCMLYLMQRVSCWCCNMTIPLAVHLQCS